MSSGQEISPNKVTALLAYILDMDAETPPDPDMLSDLVDAICLDSVERNRLISAVTLTQSPDIRPQVLELLGRRLNRLRDTLEEATDRDDVVGIWSQRLAGGAILAGAGTVLGGLATGVLAVVAISAPLITGAVVTHGRSRLRKRARKARRLCEETERLMELLRH